MVRLSGRFAVVEVGDRAGDAQNFVVGAGREAQLGHRGLQKVLAFVVELAMNPDLPRGHLAVVAVRAAGEAATLDRAGGDHRLAHLRRSTCPPRSPKALERHGRHFDVDVDAIEQRAGDFAHVPFDLRHRCSGNRGADRCDSRKGKDSSAAISMKLAGKVVLDSAREIVTVPSSSGCRSTSSVRRLNSGNSSRNRTPLWLREISPGEGVEPPPTRPASLIVWCGER